MANTLDNSTDIKTLGEKIKGIRIAMMTTIAEDGSLYSRPMATQDMEFDGDLWFFTEAHAPKVGEVEKHQQINLSYTKPDDNRFVSISGTSEIVDDRQKMKDLWNPFVKAWFPNGPEDPNVTLLKVNVQKAEYWDGPSSKVVMLAHMAKSAITGKTDVPGENEKLNVE